jgi:hypothetical protein
MNQSNLGLNKLSFFTSFIILLLTFTSCENTNESKDSTKDFDWNWAKKITGISDEDEIDGITSDSFENVIVTGKFENVLTIE